MASYHIVNGLVSEAGDAGPLHGPIICLKNRSKIKPTCRSRRLTRSLVHGTAGVATLYLTFLQRGLGRSREPEKSSLLKLDERRWWFSST